MTNNHVDVNPTEDIISESGFGAPLSDYEDYLLTRNRYGMLSKSQELRLLEMVEEND